MDYLTDRSEEILELRRHIAAVERTLRSIIDRRDEAGTGGRERYLTADETCRLLHISPRTLQGLRDKRIVAFTVVGRRTILYPESALYEMLMRNYRRAREAYR